MDDTPWTTLAARWSELFPTRPARIAFCAGLAGGGALLDAGCGDGALVEALRAQGIEALGFDLDPGFVAQAGHRSGLPVGSVAQGDLRDIGTVFPGFGFAAVVSLGQTFPHLLEDADIDAFLEGARSRVVPGGNLALQVVDDTAAPVTRDLPPLRLPGLLLERTRILEGAEAVLRLRATGEDFRFTWEVRHRVWTPEALSLRASRCGWSASRVLADESGTPWAGRGAGWILVLGRA